MEIEESFFVILVDNFLLLGYISFVIDGIEVVFNFIGDVREGLKDLS